MPSTILDIHAWLTHVDSTRPHAWKEWSADLSVCVTGDMTYVGYEGSWGDVTPRFSHAKTEFHTWYLQVSDPNQLLTGGAQIWTWIVWLTLLLRQLSMPLKYHETCERKSFMWRGKGIVQFLSFTSIDRLKWIVCVCVLASFCVTTVWSMSPTEINDRSVHAF